MGHHHLFNISPSVVVVVLWVNSQVQLCDQAVEVMASLSQDGPRANEQERSNGNFTSSE